MNKELFERLLMAAVIATTGYLGTTAIIGEDNFHAGSYIGGVIVMILLERIDDIYVIIKQRRR